MLREIEKAINSGYKVSVGGGNTFELTEDDPNAVCKTARFRKLGGDVLAYKFDRSIDVVKTFGNIKTIETVFPFFTDIKGLKAMADYVLFFEKDNGHFFVIICNMKSGNDGNSNNQFNATETFVHFILESVKRTFNLDIEIDFMRRVLFSTKASYKFDKNDFNDKNKKHIPMIFSCKTSSICPLGAISKTK